MKPSTGQAVHTHLHCTRADLVLRFQTFRERNLDPLQSSVITVGIVKGGMRFNTIPEEVRLEGTVLRARLRARHAGHDLVLDERILPRRSSVTPVPTHLHRSSRGTGLHA